MNWIFRYLRELVTWAFARWSIHQAIVTLLLIVAGLVGLSLFNTQPKTIGYYLVAWLVVLILVVAPARLWHQLDERLRLTSQPRPWVTIDGYKGVYEEDDETGEEYLVETLHIVNRGDASAVNIVIPPIHLLDRKARLLNPLPTLGPGESIDARILYLRYVLERVNKEVPKVMGRPWSVRIPLTVEYRDLNHRRWATDHAITFNVMGISISIVHPNEPEEWTDVSVIQ